MVGQVGNQTGLGAVGGDLYGIVIHHLDGAGNRVLRNLQGILAQFQRRLYVLRLHFLSVMEQNALLQMEDPFRIAGVFIALHQIRHRLHVVSGLKQAVVGHGIHIVAGNGVMLVGGHAGRLVRRRDGQGIPRSLFFGRRRTLAAFFLRRALRLAGGFFCCRGRRCLPAVLGTAGHQSDCQRQRQRRRQTAHSFSPHNVISSLFSIQSVRREIPKPGGRWLPFFTSLQSSPAGWARKLLLPGSFLPKAPRSSDPSWRRPIPRPYPLRWELPACRGPFR